MKTHYPFSSPRRSWRGLALALAGALIAQLAWVPAPAYARAESARAVDRSLADRVQRVSLPFTSLNQTAGVRAAAAVAPSLLLPIPHFDSNGAYDWNSGASIAPIQAPRSSPDASRLDQVATPSIFKSSSAVSVTFNEVFTYTIVFTIPAGTTITNAVLIDTLPDSSPATEPNFTYVNGSSVGPTPGPGTPPLGAITPTVGSGNHVVTWTLGTIANGSGTPYVYSFTYRAQVGGGEDRVEVGANNAVLSHQGGSVAASTNVSVARALLRVTKSGYSASDSSASGDDVNLLRAGDKVTFTLYVTNTSAAGNVSTAYSVIVSDTLPEWMVFGGPVGATPAPNNITTVGGRTQIGWLFASLAPEASIAPLVFTATVASTVAAGRQDTNDLRGDWRDLPTDPTPDSRTDTVTVRSMNVSVSKTEVDAIDPQGRVVVNELITYTVLVTIPAGTTVYSPAHVFDTLNDGLNYGGEVSRSGPVLAPVAGPSGNNTLITWTLTGPVAAASDITMTFVFTAYSDGTLAGGPIAKGATLNNTANMRWNIGSGSGLNNPVVPQAVIGVIFVRPDIQPVKDSTPASVISSGGETIQYRVTNIRNGAGTGDASAADAFDVVITDTLPPGFGFVEAVPPPNGVITVGNTVVLTWGVVPTLPVGYYFPGVTPSAATLYVTATAPITFAASSYTNTVVVQYTDQPGDSLGEQTYFFTDTKTLNINIAETKSVTPTGQVRIGDVVTYTVADSVPAGAILYWPRHQDDLPNGVHFVSGTLTLQGTTLVSSPVPITLTQGVQERLLWWTESISNLYGSGPLFVTSTFQVRVTGINVSGGAVFSSTGEYRSAVGINNSARVDWNTQDISGTFDSFRTSNTAGNTVVQPFLADTPFAKRFGGSTTGTTSVGASDVVTYHLVITNTGQGSAYDVAISDTLPAGLIFDAFLAAGTTYTGATFIPTFSSSPSPGATGAIGWVMDAIRPGDGNTTAPSTIVTLTYSVLVTDSIGAGMSLPNQARLADYSSLPGSDPFERHYDFLLGATSAVTLTTLSPTIAKSVNVTQANWLDLITYTLAFPQPPIDAALHNVTVTDTMPSGVTVLGVQASGGVGAQAGFSGQVVTATANFVAPLSQMLITITGVVDTGAAGTKVNTATLEWDDAASGGARHTTTSNPVSTTILLPELGISKSAPTTAVPGRTFTYTIAYSNTGTSNAANVQIDDDLPNETQFVAYTASPALALIAQPDPLRWDAGTLGPGQGGSIVITLSLPATTTLGTILTNTASITTTTPGDAPGNDTSTATTLVAGSQLTITKSAAPNPAESGQPITYTLVVTNVGNAATSGLIVTDVLPLDTSFGSASPGSVQSGGQITWTLAALASSASTSVSFTAIVDSPLVSGTLITNAAYGAIASNSVNTASGSPVSVVAHSRPRLLISKSGPAVIDLGANVQYTLIVTNAGTTDAQNTTLTDNLPNELTFASFSASALVTQTAGPDPLGFDLGTLPPGVARTIWITATTPLTLPLSSVLTNTATVSTTSPGEDSADNTAQHVAPVSGVLLNIRKTANVTTIAPAGTIVYTIEYSNTGSIAATGVIVTETYDPNVTFVAANPAPNVGNNVWNTPGTLNAGQRRTIVVTVTVASALPNGTLINNLARVGANSALIKQATNVVTVTSAAVLTIDKQGHGATMPGNILVYRLNYANIGNAPATGVRLTETYPAQLTYVTANPPPTSGNNVWDLGTLTPPVSGTIVVTLTVGSGVPFGTIFTNTVAFDSDQTSVVADSFATKVGPVFLPLVLKNYTPRPNLVVQNIVVTPASPTVSQTTIISVTFVNSGTATAPAGFWVDLYVDPASAPQPGQPWNEIAPVGKAWVLRVPLAPGQSITLDTTMPDDPSNPGAVYSNWPGWFVSAGVHTLYAQVDSFGSPTGLVVELSEFDNLFGPLNVTVNPSGAMALDAETPQPLPPLDPRPTASP